MVLEDNKGSIECGLGYSFEQRENLVSIPSQTINYDETETLTK